MATEQGYLALQRSPEAEDNKMTVLWVGEGRRGGGKVSHLFVKSLVRNVVLRVRVWNRQCCGIKAS